LENSVESGSIRRSSQQNGCPQKKSSAEESPSAEPAEPPVWRDPVWRDPVRAAPPEKRNFAKKASYKMPALAYAALFPVLAISWPQFSAESLSFYGINGLILLILLCLSALVSGAEVAFFSFTTNDIEKCRQRGEPSDQRVIHLLERPKSLLATILIFNNLVNIAFVTLATFISWRMFGRVQSAEVVAGFTIVVTILLLFFGEMTPKVYATNNNVLFARITSGMLSLAQTVFKPIAWFLTSFSNLIERRIDSKGYQVTVDHLNLALDITTQDENTTEEEKGILKGIVNFGTLTVKQVMRSRLDLTAFELDWDFHELMDKVNKSGYSRVPVFDDTIDDLKGLLYVKDLLPYLNEDENFGWQNLLRPVFFVPETKKIDSLLKDFQEKRIHMAIVVDEYGGTSGLITLEDIIEEIVGEINDEFDDDDIIYNKLDENTYVFEGKTSLNDFCKVVDGDSNIFEKVKGESESLGGLLLEINNKLPRAGEKIQFNPYVFTVVSVDQRRIKRIRVLIKPVAEVRAEREVQ
jgi:gliding motility-associated protein GldE